MDERVFTVDETHGILLRPENQIRARSDELGWTSLYASIQAETPYEGLFPAVDDQLIVLHMDGPVAMDGRHGLKSARCIVPAGGLHLVPGGMEIGVRLMGALTTMHVYIRRAVIEEVAAECGIPDASEIEIPAQFLEPEPTLTSLLQAVRYELVEGSPSDRLYSDYLARAIAFRLVRRHSGSSTQPLPLLTPTGAISPVVSEALDFMRDNLDQSISLEDIAAAVNRSASHVARQFREALGISPHQYLVVMRLKKAQHLLQNTRTPIAVIAFECGFANQEHLTKMFRRWCETTPAAYRRALQN